MPTDWAAYIDTHNRLTGHDDFVFRYDLTLVFVNVRIGPLRYRMWQDDDIPTWYDAARFNYRMNGYPGLELERAG